MPDFWSQGNMTDASSVPRSNLARTVPSMAHFAGTGPLGATCAQCVFWKTIGNKKKPVCDKYRALTGDAGKAIPGLTPACRHWQSAKVAA